MVPQAHPPVAMPHPICQDVPTVMTAVGHGFVALLVTRTRELAMLRSILPYSPRYETPSTHSQNMAVFAACLACLLEVQQRVGAKAQTQRLQRDHVLHGDIGEVDIGAQAPDEVRLQALVRRFEDD